MSSLLTRAIRSASKLLPPEVKVSVLTEYLDAIPASVLAHTLSSRVVPLCGAVSPASLLDAVRQLSPLEILDFRARLNLTERLDYEGDEIYLTISSATEYPRRLACRKEPWTVKWIEEFVKPWDVLYDIGANVGAYSLVAAKRTGGRARIFAFEPAFPNFPQLCRNIIVNGLQDSVIPLPIALGKRSGLDYFNYADLSEGSALHTVGEQIDYKGQPFDPVYRQPMLTYSMDDLIDTFGLPVPNHVKIDVDGTEMDVLRGASGSLSNPAMTTMMIEICDLRVPAEEISAFLGPKGWRLKERHDRQDAEGKSLHVSYLQFVKGL